MTKSLFKALQFNALRLVMFTLVFVSLLLGVHYVTRDQIAANLLAAKSNALQSVAGTFHLDDPLSTHTQALSPAAAQQLITPDPVRYIGYQQGKPVLYVYPVTSKSGYAGTIDLLVGIDADHFITGVRVIAHKETPGLGDYIDIKKKPWILQFNHLSRIDQLALRPNGGMIDAVAGATISARAVTDAVQRVMQVHKTLQP
jgi:electron transport complex protein RnfG